MLNNRFFLVTGEDYAGFCRNVNAHVNSLDSKGVSFSVSFSCFNGLHYAYFLEDKRVKTWGESLRGELNKRCYRSCIYFQDSCADFKDVHGVGNCYCALHRKRIEFAEFCCDDVVR